MLMGGTILGPGTIFLMLVGAFVAAFHIDNWTSFEYNIIPILFFMFICFVCKSEIQVCCVIHYSALSNPEMEIKIFCFL
jgi:chitin synthase